MTDEAAMLRGDLEPTGFGASVGSKKDVMIIYHHAFLFPAGNGT